MINDEFLMLNDLNTFESLSNYIIHNSALYFSVCQGKKNGSH